MQCGDRYLLLRLCVSCRKAKYALCRSTLRRNRSPFRPAAGPWRPIPQPKEPSPTFIPLHSNVSSRLLVRSETLVLLRARPPTDICSAVPPESAIASRNNKQPYYYLPDVHLVNEELLQLQLGDDAAAENPFAAEPEQQDVQKSLEEVRRLKRRYRQRDRAAEMEKQLVAKYSPRVKEYVLERMAVLKERAKVSLFRFSPLT